MIVNHKHKFVFVNNPRAASHSIEDWLLENYGGERPRGYHATLLEHPAPEGYLAWTVIREPVARLYSLWRYENAQDGICQTFGEWLAIKQEQAKEHMYIRPQEQRIQGCQVILRYEDLPNCLEILPFVQGPVALPYLNQGPNETATLTLDELVSACEFGNSIQAYYE